MTQSSGVFSADFDKNFTKLVIVGKKSNHRRASLLVDVIFMHLSKLYADEAVDEQENQGSVLIDSSLEYIFKEKNGAVLKKLQNDLNCNITLGNQTDEGKTEIIVHANSKEQLDEALAEVSIQSLHIPIDADKFQYLKNTAHDLKDKTHCLQLVVDQDITGKCYLKAVGSHESLSDLKSIFQIHLSFFTKYD